MIHGAHVLFLYLHTTQQQQQPGAAGGGGEQAVAVAGGGVYVEGELAAAAAAASAFVRGDTELAAEIETAGGGGLVSRCLCLCGSTH